jgi:SRSO17 transposase
MEWNQKLWKRSVEEFGDFIEPLVANLGRSERRKGAALYVQGLLMEGERKSVEPMAQRLGVDSQKLQQLVADSPWPEQEAWRAIRREVIPLLEPLQAWIVDETGWLKQGSQSVGVSHQYCGAVGKQANCQVSVEVVVSDGEIAAPVAGRLYLPENWANDELRRRRARVPEEIGFQSKPEIALELLKEVVADGVSRAPVLGDEVYGASSQLRAGLREMGLEYFLNAGGDLLAWPQAPEIRRAKKYWGIADNQPAALHLETLANQLSRQQWQSVSWRAADGTRRTTRIGWLAVYVLSDLDRLTGQWPQSWLVVDWPQDHARPYHLYLAHFHHQPSAKRCLRLSRGRFPIEQFFQRTKTDLGLDHYEGRSWTGFHHHLVLAALAYLFVLVVYLRSKKNSWCYVGSGTARDSAVADALAQPMSVLQNKI